MLSVYLSGIYPAASKAILECLKQISREESGEERVRLQLAYSADSHRETRKALDRVEVMSVFMVGINGKDEHSVAEATALGTAIRAQNRDHYLVYVLSEESTLANLLPYLIDISGVILPPYVPEQILKVVEKITSDYSLITRQDQGQQSCFVALKYLGALVRLRPESIDYVEAMDKKLQIHHREKDISIYEKMGSMHQKLGNRFFQCHRSYLVNCDSIYRIDLPKMEIELFDGTIIPIARGYRAEAQKLLEEMEAGTPNP